MQINIDKGYPYGVYCHQRGDDMNKRDEATQRYQDKNMRKILLKINRKTEPEILERIEKQDNMQGYIKRLILEDIERNK